MRTSRLVTLLVSVMVIGMASDCYAEVSKKELKSIQTPDKVKTSIGTLRFLDGAPTASTAKKVSG